MPRRSWLSPGKGVAALLFSGALHAGPGLARASESLPPADRIDAPGLFERVRDGLARPVAAGLAMAQRPFEKGLDEVLYRVMRAKYGPRLIDATPQMKGTLERLAASLEGRSYPWRLLYIDDPAVNVISTSYGRIYVFAGLVDGKLTEAELAAILAHEMAHTLERHVLRRLQLTVGAAALTMAVSAVLQSQLGPGVMAAVPLGFWLEHLALLRMNRGEELDADARAVELLRRSPFGCAALPHALDQLAQRGSGASGSGLWKYLEGHPPAADRIARARRLCDGR